jgi:hypothetical protein
VRIYRKPPNRWRKYTYTNIHLTNATLPEEEEIPISQNAPVFGNM